MSALSAIAEVPNRVDNLFVQNGISDNGIYALRMYALGVPFTQIVDDYLPLSNDRHIFGGLGKDGSVWGSIVEKAYGKRYGNYEHLVGGWMSAAVSIVNGSPWEEFNHINITKEDLWTKLRLFDSRNDILTAGSWFCNTGPADQGNIACGHAYTIIQTYELNNGLKLLKMRNPWGTEQYNGPYSDGDYAWTEYIKEAVDYVDGGNEGIFYMDLDSYFRFFQQSTFNRDTTEWNLKYFMQTDDPQTNVVGGASTHRLGVTNTGPAQKIHVGAHVWQDYNYGFYSNDCAEAIYQTDSFKLTCVESDTTKVFDTYPGTAWLDAIDFGENETKYFDVAFDWDMKGYGIEKDWSLTAWGENHATFTVTHSDSTLTSEKMPEHTDNIDGVTPPTPNPPGPTPDPNPVPGPVPNENCDDTDTAGALDPYGYGCEYYTED